MTGRVVTAFLAMLLGGAASAADLSLDSARAQFLAMHTDEAQREFALLKAENPKDPEVWYYLGRLQLRKYHPKAAVELLRKAVALRPDEATYRIALCEAIGVYVDEVPFYRKIGLAREVHEQLAEAVIAAPRSPDVHDGLMKFYLGAPAILGGGYQKAVDEAAEIARLDPLSGHVARSVIAIHDGRYADAERELRAGIQMAPANPWPRYKLGELQQTEKNYDAAFATFEDLIRLFPHESAPYYYFADTAARAKTRLGLGLERIQAYVVRGPQSDDDPPLATAYRLQGRLSQLASKLDAARSAYETALRMNPGDSEAVAALKKLD